MPTQYINVTVDEFENVLGSVAEFERADVDGVNEIVYDCPLPDDDLTIRVFSTLVGENARGCGDDAIRCVVWDHEIDAPVGGRKKTLRIAPTRSNPEGWAGNFKPKLRDLYANWRDHRTETCPACGAPMALRDGQYGPFLGCTRYPDCRCTQDVEE